jgi:hypothetical protein
VQRNVASRPVTAYSLETYSLFNEPFSNTN